MVDRLRIGYVAEGLSSRSGTDRYARSLAEAMSRIADVEVLTEREAKNDTTLQGLRAVLPSPRFHPLVQARVAWYVIRYLRRCDVIHSLIEQYAPGVAFAGHLLGIPVTMTLHGTYSVPPKQASMKKRMMAYMYRRMPLVTSGSPNTEEKTREIVQLGECRIIPNGVNLEKFKVLPGIKKESLLLTVGALKARKGVDTVIEALSQLKDTSVRYAVVGDDAHDGFSKKVHTMVQERGLSSRVRFYQGIADAELVSLYNRAKAFVLAAHTTSDGSFEGFPMVYYEANACGTPVITTRGFGSEYAIHDGKNGFLVEPENPQAIARSIETIFADSTHYERMRTHALEEAAKHTWNKIADILLIFYKDVIARSQSL